MLSKFDAQIGIEKIGSEEAQGPEGLASWGPGGGLRGEVNLHWGIGGSEEKKKGRKQERQKGGKEGR